MKMKKYFVTAVIAAAALAGTAPAAFTVTDVLVPQFVEGIATTNTSRIPAVFRVTLSGLTASATYREFHGAVNANPLVDNSTSNGGGNPIFINSNGVFTESNSTDLVTAGRYADMIADGSGNYTGWFGIEPTGSANRFTPGTVIAFRINGSNGSGGTTVANRGTTTQTATAISLGTGATDGTAFYGSGFGFTPSNLLFFYDNTAGTGQPVSSCTVENDGWNVSANANYATFYKTNVDQISGAWGTIIPNTLPNGIRRIEERQLSDGTIVTGTIETSADGMWGAVDTVNPTAGGTGIQIADQTPNAAVSNWQIFAD
ncbi:hypothetical protein BH09SUM1_BH09SUM1_06870 [soil metagenome]